MKTCLAVMTSTLLLAGCASTAPAPAPSTSPSSAPVASVGVAMPPVNSAVIALAPASGSLVSGRLSAMAMTDGVHITGDIGGLAPNSTHGLHVHEKGDCSAADATSAGPHFNPAGKPHGNPSAGTHHAGDLPNITAGSDGVAHVNLHVAGVSLGGAAGTNILGRALVVHGSADDYTSQPAGNSGPRIACGVVRAGG
ncbi:superoxide dismutase family protein [Lysobacter sp. TY2-98]|uniref:superoxide dismutase family protein n=1 Tax=Lysobacter sp. TY2-98 TaxID=2290922 RepID=UPI000E20323A|nr:superoxide dismutase family protein [Lysobacter sp. TY2-98]AXK73737.1 superoxide dismutase family protein [Lysobacter sp. TY2-98]